MVWIGGARLGSAGAARRGKARLGWAGQGMARRGTARQARRGAARRGRHGEAWPGRARHGEARPGLAGHGRHLTGEIMDKTSITSEVNKAVNDLYLRDGEVRPSALVDLAQPEDSPIHDAFEWDDFKAGHEYRLIQARGYIRRVRVEYGDTTERLVHVPQVVVIDDDGELVEPTRREGCYKPISVVVQNTSDYDRALEQVRSQIGSARRAYDELKDAYKAYQNRGQGKLDLERAPNFPLADKGFAELQTALG